MSKELFKTSFFYTLANGLNRASAFLYIPFLLQFLSIEDFGNFALIQTIAQLLIPVFLISSTSGIIRELKNGQERSYKVYKTFSTQLLVLNAIFSPFLLWGIDNIYFYSILLALAGGIHELNLAWFKVKESFIKFIFQVLLRISSLMVLYIFSNESITLIEILKLQYLITLVTGLLFQVNEIQLNYHFSRKIFISITSYTIYIIPHGMGIWALSSSDRFIIKYLTNDYLLGLYSLGYSIAMVLSFLNAGLASTIPQIIAKDYKIIDKKSFGEKVIKAYSLASIILFIFIISGIAVDKSFFNILKYHSNEVYFIFLFAFMGIYMLGHYYFFSFFLIYFKKTSRLARISLIAALINVSLTIVLVLWLSILGAAISTFFSYSIYFILVFKASTFLDKDLNFLSKTLISFSLITLITVLSIFIIFYFLIL